WKAGLTSQGTRKASDCPDQNQRDNRLCRPASICQQHEWQANEEAPSRNEVDVALARQKVRLRQHGQWSKKRYEDRVEQLKEHDRIDQHDGSHKAKFEYVYGGLRILKTDSVRNPRQIDVEALIVTGSNCKRTGAVSDRLISSQ